MHAPHPPVFHVHMPFFETARMKALNQQKLKHLVFLSDIDTEIRRLVEFEQVKVFAAFKASLSTPAIEQTSLDLEPNQNSQPSPLTTHYDYLKEFKFPKKESPL